MITYDTHEVSSQTKTNQQWYVQCYQKSQERYHYLISLHELMGFPDMGYIVHRLLLNPGSTTLCNKQSRKVQDGAPQIDMFVGL